MLYIITNINNNKVRNSELSNNKGFITPEDIEVSQRLAMYVDKFSGTLIWPVIRLKLSSCDAIDRVIVNIGLMRVPFSNIYHCHYAEIRV